MTIDPELRRKALPILREGRLTVLSAITEPRSPRPRYAIVRVVGRNGTYKVDVAPLSSVRGAPDVITCTCRSGAPCPHSTAALMVLGRAAA